MWVYALTAPQTFERRETASPTPDDLARGQVLLRVIAGGICGSDLPMFRGRVPWLWADQLDQGPIPGLPMHEVVGEVIASRHPDQSVGSRVVGWATDCDALAEFVVGSGDELAPYPEDLDPATAILLQPLACVIYAIDQLAPVAGTTAAVVGLGPIGLLFAHVLKSRGATRVIGVDRLDRSGVVENFGIDEYHWLSSDAWANRVSRSEQRPQTIIEAIGHQVSTITDVVSAIAPGGQIHYFGLPDDPVYPFPMMQFLTKNLTLVSGITLDRRGALDSAIAYLAEHPDLRDTYVTDVFAIEDVQQAFTAAAAATPNQIKVAIRMSDS